ncbi:MAG: flagellar export chaperone FliS [Bacillota bacterium]
MATPVYGLLAGKEKALSRYKAMSVETASPGELVLMLYNESLRAMRDASLALERNDIGGSSKSLLRAQDIVLELRTSLNPAAGMEVAANLNSMYEFVGGRLIEANIKKSQEPLMDAMKVMGNLRDGWQEVLGKHV